MVLDRTKIEKTYENINLYNNNCFIKVGRMDNASKLLITNNKRTGTVYWSDYQIKESDMRVKTANFTSDINLDLTTGLYTVLIGSAVHENFGGFILKKDYNEDTGLYTYNCQDYSREYQSKFNIMTNNIELYRVLQFLITKGQISPKTKPSTATLKKYKDILSGLRPKNLYDETIWNNPVKFNPMTVKKNILIKNNTFMEAIRNLVHGSGSYIDVYFTENGVLHLEPYNRDDWLSGGLVLTTPEIATREFSFDTTNILTGVVVNGENLSNSIGYSSESLTGLNLSAFFGNLSGSIDATKDDTQTTIKTTKTSTKTVKKEGTGIHVYMNTDNINTKASDRKLMNDIAGYLRKRGYSVTVGGIGANTHYADINKVKKNGIYFTLYGGRCAGTLKEQCYSSHYHNVLKKKNARMVVGFYRRQLTDAYLPRAHDDNFSPSGFKGWDKPKTRLLNAGVGVANGNNAKEIANAFPGFKKNNPKSKTVTTTKDTTSTNTGNFFNNLNKDKERALNEIEKSIRDLLKLKIKLPLGNPVLKNLHTNMFLWTILPEEFSLANFGDISKALSSEYNRYGAYELNRWYVEGVTITNKGSEAYIEVTVNPFASSITNYRDNRLKYEEEYQKANTNNNTNNNASNNTNKTSTNNTLSKRSDGKTDCSDTYYLATKSGRNNIKNLVNKSENKLAKQAIGKTGTNYYNYVKNCKTPEEIYKKLEKKIPAKVPSYSNCKYKCAKDAFNHPTNLNCAERARLFKACCDAKNMLCVIYHVENHYLNGVIVNGKWKTVDLCYRSGYKHSEFNGAGFNK